MSIFAFSTREEVEDFDVKLGHAVSVQGGYLPPHISLAHAWDQFQGREDRRRLFAALLDIKLSFALCVEEFRQAVRGWQRFSDSRDPNRSWSPESLAYALEAHRNLTAYILRIRSLWDKIVGFLVLFFASHRYDSFIRSKSAISAFAKLVNDVTDFPDDLAANLRQVITDLDTRFRTPEAHRTGALRKWTYTEAPWTAEDFRRLLNHYNLVNDAVHALGKVIHGELGAPGGAG